MSEFSERAKALAGYAEDSLYAVEGMLAGTIGSFYEEVNIAFSGVICFLKRNFKDKELQHSITDFIEFDGDGTRHETIDPTEQNFSVNRKRKHTPFK